MKTLLTVFLLVFFAVFMGVQAVSQGLPSGTQPAQPKKAMINDPGLLLLNNDVFKMMLMILFATYGIIVAIISLMASNPKRYNSVMAGSVITLLPRFTIRHALLIFFSISSIAVVIALIPVIWAESPIFLTGGYQQYLKVCIIFMLGMFLYLMPRIVYLIIRP